MERRSIDPTKEYYEQAHALAFRAPMPAMVGPVRMGTAGWTDKTLLPPGLFYPKGVRSPEQRLKHYAAHFAMVEVDATYYALLPPELARRWTAWTSPGFEIDVKAHPVLTGHPIDVRRLPKDLKVELSGADRTRLYAKDVPPPVAREMEARFFSFIEPLAEARQLGCVMLQFPPWFQSTRANVRRLEFIREQWPGVPFSVEFRHKSWVADERRARVFDVLRANEMSFVGVDEPDVPLGGMPPWTHVTCPSLAIIRLHGQNAKGWRRGASVIERFDYLYRPDELHAWIEPVRQLADRARCVHVIFNNCVRDYAVLNAKGLAALLESPSATGGQG